MDLSVPTQALALMAIVGGVFLVVGVRYLRTPRRVGWLMITGTIVGWEPGEVGTDFPVVEYPLPDGTSRRFRNPTTVRSGTRRTGRQVPVLVDPCDANRAELPSTATQARLLGGLLVALAVVILLVSGVVLTVALTI